MSLIIIEGARRSGKSFLIGAQRLYPVFKFDFNGTFSGLEFEKDSTDAHYLGLGKELMLQQLNHFGMFDWPFIVDRGIITNTVWAVFQKRIPIEKAKKELDWVIRTGILRNTHFVAVQGTSQETRTKDVWDADDDRVQEEIDIFNEIYKFMEERGIKIHRFYNQFNLESAKEFNEFIKKL
jgi:hypothetical protein